MFGFHPDLDRWTEIGNSGMFRPEMLRPMGLPDGVQVIAGGLSLERPTMIKFVPFAIYLLLLRWLTNKALRSCVIKMPHTIFT